MARTADNSLFHAQQRATFTADNTRLGLNVGFCPPATGTPFTGGVAVIDTR